MNFKTHFAEETKVHCTIKKLEIYYIFARVLKNQKKLHHFPKTTKIIPFLRPRNENTINK